jgi:cytochrome oxidase assembly protein ShyY1
LAGIGELEAFEKRTTLVILAAMALLAFVCFVTLGPWVVAQAAPVWWLAE